MNICFTKEQEAMRNLIQCFVKEEVAFEVERMESTKHFPTELIEKMGTLGLMGIPIPRKYGGQGHDYTTYMIAIHELSKVSAALGVILSVHTSVGTNPILHFGNEAQKKRYLPKLASGEYLGAFALTEPGAGSDAGSLKTTAKKVDDHYILNGTKSFITNGGEADSLITFARTSDEGRTKGISAFIVERSSPGLVIGKQERKMGLHGSNTVEVIFDQCVIPESQLLGHEGQGFQIAMANLNIGRLGIAAQALGIGEAALEYATTYVKDLGQMNEQITHDQGTIIKLAHMSTEVEAAKLLTYHAASKIEQDPSCRKEVSMAKMYASKIAVRTAVEAIQICGVNGYTKDHPVERFFRDAKVTEIYEGTSEIQHIVIAKELLHS